MSITNLFLIINIFILLLAFSTLSVHSNTHHHHHRRFLHQPFDSHLLPPPPFPQPPLSNSPKHPFSNSPTTTTPPFFPLFPSSPPPPLLPPTTTFPTFPANISLALPQPSSKRISRKLVAIAVSLSLLSATLIAVFLLYHRRHHHRSKPSDTDRLHLVPPNTTPSDHLHKHPPPLRNSSPSTSSEFLYLGTLFNSREVEQKDLLLASKSVNVSQPSVSSAYRKMGSPELHPLPPLPRNNFRPSYLNPDDDDDDEEFFSPRGSSGRHLEAENFEIQNSNFATTSYQRSNSASPSLSSRSPKSSRSRSTEPPAGNAPSPSPLGSPPAINTQNPMQRFGTRLPPPPPPLPPASFWETRPAVNSFEMENRNEGLEISKPKLKPLHWDKVKASSDRAMVWDHLKSSSFQLNEEMIETLFMVNSTNLNAGKNHNPYFVMPSMNQENRVLLDPKKSQNISILLRAVNLTIDEICEALFEGNTDTMGTELLESLLKMAPTRDEEHKLKEFKDEEESPFKLGPAEKFLKSLLAIPFAFKRIEAMLYIANFDFEVDYLQTSFRTLEAASEELRNNRMFMKLLEAVLKTGNRMNVGTNRGDAHAFKLDTLLKLVDIKGTDRKTTLLHFVVEEIIRSEGSRLSSTDRNPDTGENQLSTNFEEEKKLGLQVVSGLSGEFTSVKKVATMEYDVLVSEVAKLGMGMGKVGEVLNLNEKLALKESIRKFSESMKGFLKKAEEEIMKIQMQESLALRKVKEITEYFHGNSSKEEAHPFRIFTVVRDFLSVLDKVCKEVGRINETSMGSSTRQFPLPASAQPVFPVFNGTARHNSSSDDDGNERSS